MNARNQTNVPAVVLSAISGKDVDLNIRFNSYSWSINGLSVGNLPARVRNYNLRVRAIRSSTLSALAEGNDIAQLELTFKGEFPFEAVLNYRIGARHTGREVYLYYFNATERSLEFVGSITVGERGFADLPIAKGTRYVLTSNPIH